MNNYKNHQLGALERLALIFGGTAGADTGFFAALIESNKKYLSELLGTFALVFVGSGCVCADYYLVK